MGHATALSLLVLALLAGPAEAEIYRWVDAQGVVNYSDTPPRLAPVEGERDALIDEALTLSGVRTQIEGLPAQVRAGAELAKSSPLPAPERAKVARIIGDAFRAGPILAAVRAGLQKSYDATQMGLLLAQLRTPVARRMATLEAVIVDPHIGQKLREFAARLKDAPPARERVARLAQLDAATRTTDFVLELRATAVASAFKVLGALMPPEKRMTPAQVDLAARNAVEQQRDAARQETLLMFLYVYREATDQELDEYLGIEAGEPGRWFQTIYRKALTEALTAATETAVSQIAKAFRPKPL